MRIRSFFEKINLGELWRGQYRNFRKKRREFPLGRVNETFDWKKSRFSWLEINKERKIEGGVQHTGREEEEEKRKKKEEKKSVKWKKFEMKPEILIEWALPLLLLLLLLLTRQPGVNHVKWRRKKRGRWRRWFFLRLLLLLFLWNGLLLLLPLLTWLILPVPFVIFVLLDVIWTPPHSFHID